MSRAERAKGIVGEREVADLLRSFELPVDRTVQNSGFFLRGDLTGVEGFHIEVKRHETLRLPTWIRQAESECGDAVPVVAFRQNRGQWYATLPLRDLARLIAAVDTANDPRPNGRPLCTCTRSCQGEASLRAEGSSRVCRLR